MDCWLLAVAHAADAKYPWCLQCMWHRGKLPFSALCIFARNFLHNAYLLKLYPSSIVSCSCRLNWSYVKTVWVKNSGNCRHANSEASDKTSLSQHRLPDRNKRCQHRNFISENESTKKNAKLLWFSRHRHNSRNKYFDDTGPLIQVNRQVLVASMMWLLKPSWRRYLL